MAPRQCELLISESSSDGWVLTENGVRFRVLLHSVSANQGPKVVFLDFLFVSAEHMVIQCLVEDTQEVNQGVYNELTD